MAKPKKEQIIYRNCFECTHEENGRCKTKLNDRYPDAEYSKAREKVPCDTYFKPKKG